MHRPRLPLIPSHILKRYKVEDVGDTRFRACARLLQALWREERGLPIGVHQPTQGQERALGSRLDAASARAGRNFLTHHIAKVARYESVYREPGAFIDEDRLWHNMLSSQPLCFNLFGPMKLDDALSNRFWSKLFPARMAQVEQVLFEHSPGRGSAVYTDDNTAFDVLVSGRNAKGQRSFIAIEMKYSESMQEPVAGQRARYDELSEASALFKDHRHAALRGAPLQQLWREHLLCRAMLDQGDYKDGMLLVIHPARNADCADSVSAYRSHLVKEHGAQPAFGVLTLEQCVQALEEVGEGIFAKMLNDRYLDFDRITRLIFEELEAWPAGAGAQDPGHAEVTDNSDSAIG